MNGSICVPIESCPTAGIARPGAERAPFRVLVAGHTYALRINQQKLDALAQRCSAVGLLVPSNWRNLNGLDGGQRFGLERGYGSFAMFAAPVARRPRGQFPV
jgi:hypothetical protein